GEGGGGGQKVRGGGERGRGAFRFWREAPPRLAEASSPPLEKRLKQAQLDCTIAADLQRVRESSPLGLFNEIDYRQRATEFQEAFERAELRIGEDAQPVADYIRASAIRDQLVAALED